MSNSSPLKSFFAYLAVCSIIAYGFYSFASDTFFKYEEDTTVYSYTSDNEPTFTENFRMNGSGNLDVITSGGKIMAQGHNGKEVEVRVFVRKSGKVLAKSDKLMQKLEDGFDMRIEKSGSTIYAHAKRKGNGMPWKRMSVSFEVMVPHDMSSKLKTSGGSIKIAELNGAQSLHTSGGSINIEEVDGAIDAKTSGGSIKIHDVEGELMAHTSGGSITIENAEGNIEAKTSGGRITLNDVEASNIDAKTSGGSISVEGSARMLKAHTSGGSIKANVRGLSESLSLGTSGGSIHATVPADAGMDLDLKGNRVNVSLNNFSGTAKKNYVQGAMNGGGMPVSMRTSGGSVNLEFQ